MLHALWLPEITIRQGQDYAAILYHLKELLASVCRNSRPIRKDFWAILAIPPDTSCGDWQGAGRRYLSQWTFGAIKNSFGSLVAQWWAVEAVCDGSAKSSRSSDWEVSNRKLAVTLSGS
jgi:hypothetical protein